MQIIFKNNLNNYLCEVLYRSVAFTDCFNLFSFYLKDGLRSSPTEFAPQIPMTTRSRPKQNQEPRTPGFPTLVAGTQVLESSPAASEVHLNRKLNSEIEPGLEPGTLKWDVDVLSDILTIFFKCLPQSQALQHGL